MHGNASVLAFADGHADAHRWTDSTMIYATGGNRKREQCSSRSKLVRFAVVDFSKHSSPIDGGRKIIHQKGYTIKTSQSVDKFEQENLRRGRIKLEFGGVANQLGGAVGRFRDLLQSRRQQGVFLMFSEKAVGVALDNGEEIVQLVRQGE